MFAVVKRRSLPVLLAVWTAMATAPLRADDEAVPAENLLPTNVVLFINIPNVDHFKARLDESSFGDLLRDESLVKIREEVAKKWEEASEKVEEEIGMPLADLLAIPSGTATFALVQPPAAFPAGVLILDAGEQVEDLQALLEKAAEELKKKNATSEVSEFDGVEITTWTKADAEGTPLDSFSYILEDSIFVVSNSIDIVKDVITRWDGEHTETFADTEVFSYILDATQDEDSDPVLTWFIDPIGLVQSAVQAAGPEAGMQAGMAMSFLPVLGLDRLKGFGGVTEIGTEDYEAVSRALIYVEPPATGIIKVFRFPPANLAPPKFIAASTPNISGMNWDVPGAYSAIEQMVDFFTTPGRTKKFLDDAAKHPASPGIHPKTDFIDLLSGRNFIIQEMPKVSEENPEMPEQRMVLLLGTNNQSRMEEVIGKIAAMEGVGIETRDFNGTKIFEPGTGGRTPFQPAFAVSNGYLIFSSTASMLEGLLRGNGGEALADSEDFKTVAEEFPAEVSTFSFQRTADIMEGVYELILQGMAQNDDFDVSVMPEFKNLKKYFGLGGSYSVPDEKGVLMISFSLRP